MTERRIVTRSLVRFAEDGASMRDVLRNWSFGSLAIGHAYRVRVRRHEWAARLGIAEDSELLGAIRAGVRDADEYAMFAEVFRRCEELSLLQHTDIMLEMLTEQLRAGWLVLRGFNEAGEWLQPRPEWFTDVAVDLEGNWIKGPNGQKLYGALIYHPKWTLEEEDRDRDVGDNYDEVIAEAVLGGCDTISGAGGANNVTRRGPKPEVRRRVRSAMLSDLREGRTSIERLAAEKQVSLAATYCADRRTCAAAMADAISAWERDQQTSIQGAEIVSAAQELVASK